MSSLQVLAQTSEQATGLWNRAVLKLYGYQEEDHFWHRKSVPFDRSRGIKQLHSRAQIDYIMLLLVFTFMWLCFASERFRLCGYRSGMLSYVSSAATATIAFALSYGLGLP